MNVNRSRPDSFAFPSPAADRPAPRRLYLHEPGWQIGLKVGSEREFCYAMAPGQDYYHRLLDGEATSGDGQSADEFEALLDEMSTRIGSDATPARLQGLWLYRMILTARPLRERMTLFWHNHFATSLAKVENPVLMQRQNGLLREHALGKFGVMLDAVGKDPAKIGRAHV